MTYCAWKGGGIFSLCTQERKITIYLSVGRTTIQRTCHGRGRPYADFSKFFNLGFGKDPSKSPITVPAPDKKFQLPEW